MDWWNNSFQFGESLETTPEDHYKNKFVIDFQLNYKLFEAWDNDSKIHLYKVVSDYDSWSTYSIARFILLHSKYSRSDHKGLLLSLPVIDSPFFFSNFQLDETFLSMIKVSLGLIVQNIPHSANDLEMEKNKKRSSYHINHTADLPYDDFISSFSFEKFILFYVFHNLIENSCIHSNERLDSSYLPFFYNMSSSRDSHDWSYYSNHFHYQLLLQRTSTSSTFNDDKFVLLALNECVLNNQCKYIWYFQY